MGYHSRNFGDGIDPKDFPGISPSELRPGDEPQGFEGIVLPAPGIELLNVYQLQEAQQRAQQFAHVAISPAEDKPLWEESFTFGAVKRPEQNSLRGYKRVLRIGSGDQDIQFSPQKYGIFDAIVVNGSGKSNGKSLNAAFNEEHSSYDAYAPLRRNLAILRNYLLVTQFPDAEYKPNEKSAAGKEDAANYIKVQQMAKKLGYILGAGRPVTLVGRFLYSVKRLLLNEEIGGPYTNAFLEKANVPDKGIEVMYEYLYGLQSKPSLEDIWPFSKTPRTWAIPPVAQTPFSEPQQLLYGRASVTQGIAADFDLIISQLRSVDTLSVENKKISVDYAREILEKLKLLMGNSYEESIVGRTSNPHEDEAWMLLRAARSYKDLITDIAQIDPAALLNNPVLAETLAVMEQISYRVKSEAVMMMKEEGRDGAAKLLAAQLAAMPESAKTTLPLNNLVGKLKTGVNEAANIRQSLIMRAAQLQQQSRAKAKVKAEERKTGHEESQGSGVPITAVRRAGQTGAVASPRGIGNLNSAAQQTFASARIGQVTHNNQVLEEVHHHNEEEAHRRALQQQQLAASRTR